MEIKEDDWMMIVHNPRKERRKERMKSRERRVAF